MVSSIVKTSAWFQSHNCKPRLITSYDPGQEVRVISVSYSSIHTCCNSSYVKFIWYNALTYSVWHTNEISNIMDIHHAFWLERRFHAHSLSLSELCMMMISPNVCHHPRIPDHLWILKPFRYFFLHKYLKAHSAKASCLVEHEAKFNVYSLLYSINHFVIHRNTMNAM